MPRKRQPSSSVSCSELLFDEEPSPVTIPLVKILWLDAQGNEDWISPAELADKGPLPEVTCGLLLRETPAGYLLALTIEDVPRPDCYDNWFFIPREMVKEFQVIGQHTLGGTDHAEAQG